MAFLYHKITRKVLLTIIILWGTVSFLSTGPTALLSVLTVILSIFGIFFVIFDVAPIFLLIFLSFLTSFALYNFLFQFNLPVWAIMLAILIVFGYFFYYTEQKIGILGRKRLIYLVLFSLLTLEVFFALNYFLISPLSKSLIIASISYLFIGFCYTVLAQHEDKRLRTYLILASTMIVLIFMTSIWGNTI